MNDDESDPWIVELEALECIVDAKNISFPNVSTKDTVSIQVLYGSDDTDDEFWIELHRFPGYPSEALLPMCLTPSTKQGTPVDLEDLGAQLTQCASEAAAIGSEAAFSILSVAKEFVERCIEQDSNAALRALKKIDSVPTKGIMKHISHDPVLLDVYRELDLTETTVLLTKCETNSSFMKALQRNVQASIELYRMIHGDGIWSDLVLDHVWEVGFDAKDKSFAARRFKERQQTVGRAKRRQLLWHGSALSAIACILTNGSLRKVQRAAHGRMFGDGVYFADCMCKSLSYCSGSRPHEFYLLLCSVDLDQSHHTEKYFEDVDPQVLDSGVPLAVAGNLTMAEITRLDSGDRLAIGQCQWRRQVCAVNFNEYIVFREEGHVNRYLVRLRLKADAAGKRRIYGR
uniref:Poly [ADP-ribose] polymerase n=1 Tax=Eutreptiella gymnastica TaxID=73025 RepID=A0A7S1N4U0_9EUGL|mmetsp:Transcript_119502/g.208055  ORF Transcript_119502/g.208055 Transcript_119502/m.208055 type:complete len:401 (+) Transcript_119502:47-1249(+)